MLGGKGAGAGRVDVSQFSPQHLYFYISLLPGLNGLQNRLNASSDLQQHRFLPGIPLTALEKI